MRSRARITDVRFSPAGSALQRDGLLGWATFLVDGRLIVDGVMVRRRQDGGLTLAWPTRRDRHGVLHNHVRPLDDTTRRELEREILAQLGPWLRASAV